MNFNDSVDLIKNDLIMTTQELVQIKSVQDKPVEDGPFGEGVKSCLIRTLEICKEMGFNTKNIDGYAGYAEWGKGDELIGILVHLDVVPEGSGWTYPPFSGQIVEDKIYGRGTSDNKGPAVSVIYALKILKESMKDFNKRVRIIFGCNEESGWGGINYYIKNEEIPDYGFTPDGLFPIINSEKGIMRINLLTEFDVDDKKNSPIRIVKLKGGVAPNMVPDYCECEIEFKPDFRDKFNTIINQYISEKDISIKLDEVKNKCTIKSTGVAVASSIPEKGKNAISQLLGIIYKINSDNQSSQEKFIKFIVDNIGKQVNGENMGIKMEDDVSGPLTLNIGIAEIDSKQGKIILDIRYPVKKSEEEIVELIKIKIKNTNIKIEKGDCKAPLFIPKDHFLIKILSQVYEEVTGDKAELLSIGGGTYARALDNCVAFGGLFPGREILAHRKDEYIYIEDLIKMTKIYIPAIKALVENTR